MLKVIIDFDGTLTAEEEQVEALSQLSLRTLAEELLHVSLDVLEPQYRATRSRLLREPHRYRWEVNGLVASYCDEGAFILNTTTLQTMLRENADYVRALERAFATAEYDPVVDATNYLFHRHTAELEPVFRPGAGQVLEALQQHPCRRPIILTNSLGDKVARQVATLGMAHQVDVLGDTRQYDMDPRWRLRVPSPGLGDVQEWRVDSLHTVDLRRPAYHRALCGQMADGSALVVVADTFSLPGALPLMMGIPFVLMRTPYTPDWCLEAVASHPLGSALEDLRELPAALARLGHGVRG